MSKDQKELKVEFINLGGDDLPAEIKEAFEKAFRQAVGNKDASTKMAEKAAEITVQELLEIERLSAKHKMLSATIEGFERGIQKCEEKKNEWWVKIKTKYGLEADEHLKIRGDSTIIDRIVTVKMDPAPSGPLN